jgi:hypothetical protein
MDNSLHYFDNSSADENFLDDQIERTRIELQRLRQEREQEQHEWTDCLHQKTQELDRVQKALHKKLNSSRALHHHHGRAMECLKQQYFIEGEDAKSLPPLYVLNKEAALLSTTMFSFSGLHNQTRLIQSHHQTLVEFLERERLQVLTQLDEANRQSVEKVSLVAEHYNTCYDGYQRQIGALEREIRNLLKHLQEKDDDTHVSSETEHSISEGSLSMMTMMSHDDDVHDEVSSFHDDSSTAALSSMFTDFLHSSLDNIRKLPVGV